MKAIAFGLSIAVVILAIVKPADAKSKCDSILMENCNTVTECNLRKISYDSCLRDIESKKQYKEIVDRHKKSLSGGGNGSSDGSSGGSDHNDNCHDGEDSGAAHAAHDDNCQLIH